MKDPSSIVCATGNDHKVTELKALLESFEVTRPLQSAAALGGMPAVEENAPDFEGNARLKAVALIDKAPAGTLILSDDSGLCVDALDGEPGIRSARFAGEAADAKANNALLLDRLGAIPFEARTGQFICVLCLLGATGKTQFFTGICRGNITTDPRGEKGFGYDPLFQPDGYSRTLAELGPSVKNRISHRALAVEKLARYLRSTDG